MNFSEKLNFLLKITDTSNKQLSAVLAVDPSLISRMRQDRRKPPQNSAHVVGMANYFAKKCMTDYQRSALSETIGQERVKLITKTEVLSSILNEWLADDIPSAGRKVEQLIHEIARDTTDDINVKATVITPSKGEIAHSHAYYGNKGKRAATRAFFAYLIQVNAPCTICIATDESIEWLTESPSFSAELTASLLKLTEAGYSFKRIASRLWDISDAVDSVSRWLPVYMLGKLDSWYYRRIRDNVFHRTIFAAPGLASVCSSSVGNHTDADLTFLNVNPGMADAAVREFNDYLALCVPLTTIHRHGDEGESICDCLQRFINTPGDRSAKYLGLPALITPPSVLRRALAGKPEYIDTFISHSKTYEKTLSQYKRTDVIVLADSDDVRAGRVVCTASLLAPDTEPYYYTNTDYIEHLRVLLRLMEENPDYTVIIADKPMPDISICAINDNLSYVIRCKEPVTLFEISEHSFVSAANEYILSLGNTGGRKTNLRIQTMDRIRELIRELERC